MNTKPITIKNIIPIEIIIENHESPAPNSDLQLNLQRKLEKQDNDFKIQLLASVFKEAEKDIEEKSFFIKYSLEAHLSCDHEEISIEDLHKEATNILYPYIRSGISAAMGAIGMRPIMLPPICN